ncbi:MAG: hypothetical protein EA409_09410 [Saprospirales bacterium]|nr:MAG: hypothetical protein EA409_09410 [Saprospirales bacterium]
MLEIETFKNPFYLASASFLTGMVIVVIGLLSQAFIELPDNGVFVWGIFTAMILIYSLFNTIMLFSFNAENKYWTLSVYSFIALGSLCVLTSWGLTGISLNESGGFRSIISILVIGYTIFLGIGWSIMKIVSFTMQRDQEKLKRDSDSIGHDLN